MTACIAFAAAESNSGVNMADIASGADIDSVFAPFSVFLSDAVERCAACLSYKQ